MLCRNTCSHTCRSYCLELRPGSWWSPAVWLCALVSSIFLELSCVCSSGISQGQQEAGRKALSNRAEKHHCQCRMWPFPTENYCTDAVHGLKHSILLKAWIWLWVWRWAILATGPCKKCDRTLLSQGIVSSWQRDLCRFNWEESFAWLVSMWRRWCD